MENSSIFSENVLTKRCKVQSLSKYPTKFPTYTTISSKNFKYQVNFHPEEKLPCKNTWYRDVKSTHIRNRRLLDLPYNSPKCCTDIYNVVLDRQLLKKVQKYGLTRPVRTIVSGLEMAETKKCEPAEEKDAGETYSVCFPECYEPPECSSEDEEDEYKFCSSGSVSECSGCNTLGGGTRRKMHQVIKKDWRDLLYVSEVIICKESVAAEISKHKFGRNFPLKLKKVF